LETLMIVTMRTEIDKNGVPVDRKINIQVMSV
jgi:hypothetical protein